MESISKLFNKNPNLLQNIAAGVAILSSIFGLIYYGTTTYILPKFYPDIIVEVKLEKNTVPPIKFSEFNKNLFIDLQSSEKYEDNIKESKEKSKHLNKNIFYKLQNPDRYFDKVKLKLINRSNKIISNLDIQIDNGRKFKSEKPFWGINITGNFLDKNNIEKFKSYFNDTDIDNIVIQNLPKIPKDSFIELTFFGDFDGVKDLNPQISSEGNTYKILNTFEVDDYHLAKYELLKFFALSIAVFAALFLFLIVSSILGLE